MVFKPLNTDDQGRTIDQIKAHYEIEKVLAHKLRSAIAQERQHLYTELYEQLFQRVPDHPQISVKQDAQASARKVNQKMKLVSRYIHADSVFLEVGPGDCHFSFAIAPQVKQVFAVDVSSTIAAHQVAPPNFSFALSDGCSIPVADQSITVAYSNQLMEHLHPEDANRQLHNLYNAIAPNGVYICITPNRLSGPHDVSQYFDEVATGFHLKEYTWTELTNLLAEVGFRRFIAYIGGKGIYIRFPLMLLKGLEVILNRIPFSWRRHLARTFFFKALLGVNIVAIK